jgi:hypothetical protein
LKGGGHALDLFNFAKDLSYVLNYSEELLPQGMGEVTLVETEGYLGR